MRRSLLPLLISALITTALSAKENGKDTVIDTYSFGGACASVGNWSQMALSQGETIKSAINQLRNDENCKGIESIIPTIELATDAVNANNADQSKEAESWDNLPNEMASLTKALGNDVSTSGAIKTMLGKTLQNVILGNSPLEYKKRSMRMAKTGLDLIDKTASVLPQYQQCLYNNPNQALAIFGATLKLTSSYISSGETITSKAGNTIAKLVTFLREKKFTKILGKLESTKYWISMSCILETTTNAYCAAKDAREMLKMSKADERLKKEVLEDSENINPLEGYYLLSREIPTISKWISDARLGVPPRLKIDGVSKTAILANINDMFKDRFELLGTFADSVQYLKKLDNVTAKKNYILKMIDDLTIIIKSDSRYGSNADQKNFFTMSVPEDLLPFYLIGRDTIPNECTGKGSYPMEWNKYMLTQGKSSNSTDSFIEEFDNIDNLISIIDARLKVLIKEALDNGNAYYLQRMLVDINNLVDESLTSQNISVFESLVRTGSYLDKLIKRITARQENTIILPNLLDTKIRIDNILNAYDEVRDIVKDHLDGYISRDQLKESITGDQKLANAYTKIISRTFSEFNIIFQRETFLLTRLETFVNYDYASRINDYDNLSDYQKDMMIVAGKNLIERLTDAHGSDVTAVELDLNQAQTINSTNIDIIESMFANAMVPVIAETKLVADDIGDSNLSLNIDTLHRLYDDSLLFTKIPFRNEKADFVDIALDTAKRALISPYKIFYNLYQHGDRYDFRGLDFNKVITEDDSYGSYEKVKSKLCIQTLAFRNHDVFNKLCSGSRLESMQDLNDDSIALAVDYDEMISNIIDTEESKDREAYAIRRDENICAFRNYRRRHQAYNLIKSFEK